MPNPTHQRGVPIVFDAKYVPVIDGLPVAVNIDTGMPDVVALIGRLVATLVSWDRADEAEELAQNFGHLSGAGRDRSVDMLSQAIRDCTYQFPVTLLRSELVLLHDLLNLAGGIDDPAVDEADMMAALQAITVRVAHDEIDMDGLRDKLRWDSTYDVAGIHLLFSRLDVSESELLGRPHARKVDTRTGVRTVDQIDDALREISGRAGTDEALEGDDAAELDLLRDLRDLVTDGEDE